MPTIPITVSGQLDVSGQLNISGTINVSGILNVLMGDNPSGTAATTTWNPADKAADITLSGGDLVASHTGGGNGIASVRAVASASSGKKYWEVVATGFVDVSAQSTAAFGNASSSVTGLFGFGNANGLAWLGDGSVIVNSVNLGSVATYTTSDTCCIALDLDNSKVWFRKNGGNWNNDILANQNPATNTGGTSTSGVAAGPYYAGVTLFVAGSDVFSANFGATAYSQTAPAGFGNW